MFKKMLSDLSRKCYRTIMKSELSDSCYRTLGVVLIGLETASSYRTLWKNGTLSDYRRFFVLSDFALCGIIGPGQ